MRPLFLALALALTGCVSMDELVRQPQAPGYIAKRVAVYDEATELQMNPAWLLDTENMQLALHWRTPMQESVIVVAALNGAELFSAESPLLFRIDGEEVGLPPRATDDYGQTDTVSFGSAGSMNVSKKSYVADRAFIRRILDADTVLVRAELLGAYIDGRFSMDSPDIDSYRHFEILAKPSFERFYEEAWGNE
ncbi:MAG: hypothetical protein AAGJ55_07655 [Cyanobacteria bacterium J06555_12]